MKAKKLLLIASIITWTTLNLSAQNVLVSENFSTDEWEAEFVRLNPGSAINPNCGNINAYLTPAAGTAYTNMNGTDIYFDKYQLFSGAIDAQAAGTLVCPDGITHYNADNGGVNVAWRLKKTSAGVSYITLPKISSAGDFTLHVKSAGGAASVKLQKVQIVDGNPVVTDLKTWSLTASSNTKFTTQIDEIKTFWVDSRDSITLRIGQAADIFVKIFGFVAEEHASVPLKHSIDSATAIRTANAENIGTAFGQYPQAAYDALGTAITDATAIFDNLSSTKVQLIDGTTSINTAISDFEASKADVGTGIGKPMMISFKQTGRKLELNKTAKVTIYNTLGSLVFEQDNAKIVEVPSAIGNGIFLVKSGLSVQKIYLNN